MTKHLMLILLLFLASSSVFAQETNNGLIDEAVANAGADANAVAVGDDTSAVAKETAEALVPPPAPVLDAGQKLNKIFPHIDPLKDVKAAYIEGVVTLTGESLEEGARDQAEELAKKMDDHISCSSENAPDHPILPVYTQWIHE